ncbi:MAG TPA: thiamine-phosphate kinase [Gammaproteobacteria bacterium]|nr:thiamine-phosphate kinase [Gammaproteobacteria bacterium]
MSEFSLIEKYFSELGKQRSDVLLGVGDDAAVVNTPTSQSLAISVDTLIAGVHFPQSTKPYDIGWKSLAVNLSDMAAMAAKPCWATLALSLPDINDDWLRAFSRGFSDLAALHNVQLVGGDTTRSPLSITVQIIGSFKYNKVLRRDRAVVGDGIYVTGWLGEAALGLKSMTENLPLAHSEIERLRLALNRPKPRVDEMLKLSSYINAAIDISDGLAADLSHIVQASQVAANVDVSLLPVSERYARCNQGVQFYDLALCGGDDYQLCFTVAKNNEKKLCQEAEKFPMRCTKIGEVVEGSGIRFRHGNKSYTIQQTPYDHFIREN